MQKAIHLKKHALQIFAAQKRADYLLRNEHACGLIADCATVVNFKVAAKGTFRTLPPNGHSGISAEMAMRLSIALDTPASLWMNLQRDYDLWIAEKFKKKLHVEKIKRAA